MNTSLQVGDSFPPHRNQTRGKHPLRVGSTSRCRVATRVEFPSPSRPTHCTASTMSSAMQRPALPRQPNLALASQPPRCRCV